jgi:hypothetical protein
MHPIRPEVCLGLDHPPDVTLEVGLALEDGVKDMHRPLVKAFGQLLPLCSSIRFEPQFVVAVEFGSSLDVEVSLRSVDVEVCFLRYVTLLALEVILPIHKLLLVPRLASIQNEASRWIDPFQRLVEGFGGQLLLDNLDIGLVLRI